jgi:hypothetical protein
VEQVGRRRVPNETNKAQKAPNTQSHACKPPSGNDDGSIKLGGAGVVGPASALDFAIPSCISPSDKMVSFWLCSEQDCVSDVWFCFSGSVGNVSRVLSEFLAASILWGVAIMEGILSKIIDR